MSKHDRQRSAAHQMVRNVSEGKPTGPITRGMAHGYKPCAPNGLQEQAEESSNMHGKRFAGLFWTIVLAIVAIVVLLAFASQGNAQEMPVVSISHDARTITVSVSLYGYTHVYTKAIDVAEVCHPTLDAPTTAVTPTVTTTPTPTPTPTPAPTGTVVPSPTSVVPTPTSTPTPVPTGTPTPGLGNPGNAKPVGRAGEAPPKGKGGDDKFNSPRVGGPGTKGASDGTKKGRKPKK